MAGRTIFVNPRSEEDWQKLTGGPTPVRGPAALSASARLADLPPVVVPDADADGDDRLRPGMCIRRLLRRLRTQPPPPWPEGFKDWDVVRRAHRLLLDDAVLAARNTAYPAGRFSGRGIVIPAGGWAKNVYSPEPQPYFWCAFAAAWVLRRRGCLLPIQFWFLGGELQPGFREAAARVGAECVDASANGVQASMRCPSGWQLKVHAILNCPWREVIHVDADNIAAINPEELFSEPGYAATGALFWADNPGLVNRPNVSFLTPDAWDRLGMSDGGRDRCFETGQIVLDKGRCWVALQVTKHFADYADYWGGFNGQGGGVWYGDKEDFHCAWRKTKTPYHLYDGHEFVKRESGTTTTGFYLHRDSRGRAVWQHCCQSKGHLVNGHEVGGMDGNQIVWESVRFGRDRIPWADGSAREASRLISPEKYFDLYEGDGGQCRTVWLDVVSRNEYGLPDDLTGKTVIDVGGNVGAFAYACLRRGARLVASYEPFPESARKLRANCDPFAAGRLRARASAVWRSDGPRVGKIPLHPHAGAAFTGGYSTVLSPSDPGLEVPYESLDLVLCELGGVDLLKADAEAAEFPIFYTSKELRRVAEVVGEYHSDGIKELAGPPPVSGWKYEWSERGLGEFFRSIGFLFESFPSSSVHGLFRASRV